MKEVVLISGKGGTGKTSLAGAFASLSGGAVLADCDVDTPNLAIILEPFLLQRQDFLGGLSVSIDPDLCNGCGLCKDLCRFGAISLARSQSTLNLPVFKVDPLACEGCGVCAYFCPTGAVWIQGNQAIGEWFRATTRFGPMIHARLKPGKENSGKLVTLVRIQARKTALELGYNLILVDGPPGIGCPVIASITGSDIALVITEPTISGFQDLSRALRLTSHFGIKTMMLINKWDLNPEISNRLEEYALKNQVTLAGRISYDETVTRAQMSKKTIVEFQTNGIVGEISRAWELVSKAIQ
jgi:MinD superfamily P-loop ATPase